MTALSVMGLTYQAMKGKLIKALGPGGAEKVSKAESTVEALKTMKGGTGKTIQESIKSEVTKSLVMAGIQYDSGDTFTASQTLWLKFVDADCQFDNLAANESQGDGYSLAMSACRYERYAARLKQMQNVIKDLKEIKKFHQ